MGERLKQLEAMAEASTDGLLTRVIAWRRTAVIVAVVLFLTHLAAFLWGRFGGGA